jgi:hypothetical protein
VCERVWVGNGEERGMTGGEKIDRLESLGREMRGFVGGFIFGDKRVFGFGKKSMGNEIQWRMRIRIRNQQ